ncbi:MAG: hypothetical protein JOS17DRAFT_801985 [Linnemannia elongata]|nr:MAG: hypothetical protein JOS17DRAFT_801985 [Linnemannia elongata]
MSRITFSSLPPEIIQLIGSQMDQHSLSHCSLVDHAWHSLFASSLWRSLDLSSQFRFNNSPSALKALLRNIHSLRQLATSDRELLCHLAYDHFPLLSNLQTLDLFLYNNGGFSGNEPLLPLRLLTGCVNLESLTIAGRSCLKYADDEETDAFQEVLAALPTGSFKKLSINFEVEDYSPCVERGAWSPLIDHDDEYQLAVDRQRLLPPFVALRELVLLSAYIHINPSKLALLARCPNLERLEIDSPDECAVRYLAEAILEFCPKLVELVWGGERDYSDELMGGLLRASRLGWRVLSLLRMDAPRASAYDAVMENAKTLEELHLQKWSGGKEAADHSFFLDFFCTAKNLRRLTGYNHGERCICDWAVEIHAYDALVEHTEDVDFDCKWALGSKIESLQMQIVGVPRPDVVCRGDGTPLRDWMVEQGLDKRKRYEAQRYIYDQLARMTGIRELVLGVIDIQKYDVARYGVGISRIRETASPLEVEDVLMEAGEAFKLVNYQSLEFSLESGLGLLSGLKEMRVLDVKSTAHRIGVAELEWMRLHWPKLQEIRGLVNDRKWAGDVERGLKVKKDVEEWLAAHPGGIGSLYYLGTVGS